MEKLTIAELADENVELLPSRETLAVGHANWAQIVASNSSSAVNALTLLSQANSAAVQTIALSQQ
ncbi:hypothetical protein KIH31_06840 [Paenarthrobacter sp. DKR-5]|uniref:hypothetical protein n=1 Tax=Paenarthrobacter sp. DKR-5 TaxID=2835535 RepID=UPI001BDC5140|nr:hypothetical protein [Paenarthrobacter sp. DKR-5]MBT1002315.1 hypothetical protein [Paenarthrobacter sp. DKR-5]